MSVFFFILSLVSVALTYNVLRPIYSHPKWIVPSFLLGWLVGELALHVVAVQLVLVFSFAWCGVVTGFWGAVSMMIFAGSWLMLTYFYFSSYKSKVLMDSIVIPHRRGDQNSNWKRHDEVDSAKLIRPFSIFKNEPVEVIKDVVFDEVDGFKLKLDIRRSHQLKAETEKGAPVLLQIHGGAWTHGYGSKNEQAIPLMHEMANQGWICVAISYRLSPKATFPDHIVDCKKALVWVKEHIAEYGGNPDFIVATGGSAGGHLSSLLSLTPNVKEFQPGFEEKDTSVQGCVPIYGIYDLMDSQKLRPNPGLDIIMRKNIIKERKEDNPELYGMMSPLRHVNADAPPFLVVHGDKDSLTSLGEAQYFASRLDQVSTQSIEFAEVPGGQHGFEVFPSLRCEFVVKGVAERMSQWHRDYTELPD